MTEIDRRNFLKLVGVSAGAAAASGCNDPVQKLIPYVVQPEEITPGLAVTYASTCQECPAGCGLHVRTREGRPVKLEGNPDHPVNRGALCARGQASIGRTYLPDRYPGPMRRQSNGGLAPISWEEAHALVAEKVAAAGGRTHVLGGSVGPTLSGLVDKWIEAVGAGGRTVYELFDYTALKEASRSVFGIASRPRFDLSRADLIVDFGSDFLESWTSPVEHGRQFAEARTVDQEGGGTRLVYVGSRLTLTAGNSDEWLPAKPGTEGVLALGIARAALDAARAGGEEVTDADRLRAILSGFGANSVSTITEVPAATIKKLGAALLAADQPVALPPGVALTSRSATATTAAVLLLNLVVGAIGKTVLVVPDGSSTDQVTSYRDMVRLVKQMKTGAISVLLVHDANPVYSMPGGSGFAEALEKVGFVISTAPGPDETSERADLIVPDHTPMESWGDHAPRPGVRSIVQPTIRPLYDTRAFGDTLIESAKAMGEATAARLPSGSFRSVLEEAWSDTDFRAALAAGGVYGEEAAAGDVTLAPGISSLSFKEPRLQGDGSFVLLPVPSPLLSDGRGANLPWLQETPDPVMKVTWQSWAEISHSSAEAMGAEYGDVLAVQTSVGTVELPVVPRGGIRDDVIAISIGQGHNVGFYASRIEDGNPGGTRGVNVISVLPSVTDETGGRAWLATRASVSKTGAHRRVAKTQEFDNKRERQLGEAVSLLALVESAESHGDGHAESQGDGHGGSHEMRRPFDPADDSSEESDYRWGMAIDLDRCNGCSACIVACSIENNVPTVGEELVLLDRQMQWLRIERYIGDGFQELVTGRNAPTDHEELGNTDVRHSPMMCQQCGAAPCEPVCPVFATYHNDEGLNGMIYNRCIGTRYCSNNCPYKVRRYNWFDYAIENIHEPMNLLLNPDVTVRGQGVMEKCTFCIQRIENGRQVAKDEGRPIADGEVTPACAQTCPTQAITFGNLKDDESAASKKADAGDARAYHALHVLNTRPSITYLAKVTRGAEVTEG
ncbi:MAG: 4Fe-4S dicluster domain-containing protein [Deltaproteobacteria bacterium]|nr:4Fe-4S dicluster domain-containing protein [Deltaproteobacteria bacterium]